MAIVQTLSQSEFIEAFKRSSRADQFSYEALEAIFEYLEDYSRDSGEDVEFDLVAICCDWQEATWQEVAEQYKVDLSDVEDEDKAGAVWDFLTDESHAAYRVGDDSFVFVAF
jgi:predicted ArsR family transcriptional regulator